MTKLCAVIITDDKRFERMLSLELASRGVDILNGTDTHALNGHRGRIFAIVDLDFCTSDELCELAKVSEVIGFSRAYKNELKIADELCGVFLHRPFLIDDLISVMFDGVEVHKKRERVMSKPKKQSYLTVDEVERCAVYGNERIMLTDSEYKVLSLLCENRGEAVSREAISMLLGTADSNNSDVYICMLRRKIDNRLGLKLILTVRGRGYMIPN